MSWNLWISLKVSNLDSTVSEIKNKMKGAWTDIEKSLSKGVEWWVSKVWSSFWKLGDLIAWAFAVTGIAELWRRIIWLWSNLQQTTVAFETMLWSSEKAREVLWKLSDFAATTPFTITWVRDNAKQLLAMGVDVDNLIPTMKALWDVAAWLSVPLDRLWLAYWQVLAKGRLQWWELRQFTEAWVPLISELSRNLWVAQNEIIGLVEKWQISARDVTIAFQTMSSEWWRFANLMQKQSLTFWWVMSNIQDLFTRMWEEVGTKLLPQLTSIWEWVLETVGTYGDSLSSFFADFTWTIWEIIGLAVGWITSFFNLLIWNTNKTAENQVSFLQIVVWAFKWFLIWIKIIVKSISALWSITWSALWVVFNNIAAFMWPTINNAIRWINLLIRWVNEVAKTDFKPIELFKIDIIGFKAWVSIMKDTFNDVSDDFSKIDLTLWMKKNVNWVNDLIWKIDLNKIPDWLNNATEWAEWTSNATKNLKKDMNDLKKDFRDYEGNVKDVKKATQDLEKAQEKMSSTIANWMKKLKEEIKDLWTEYSKTIDDINSRTLETQTWNAQNFIRSQAEREADLQRDIETTEDFAKRLELQKELEQIQLNISKLNNEQYKEFIEQERTRANLTDWQRDFSDFQDKQNLAVQEADLEKKKAEEKYKIEFDRLERQQKIFEFFQDLWNQSSLKLKKLKEDEKLKDMSIEEQELFQKLLTERIEYQTAIETKKRMERDLTNAIKTLSDEATAYMKWNISSLSSDYQILISQIRTAISAQQQLNNSRTSQRYLWWPVQAWNPYFVWENADGSFNPTTELFIPRQSWTIVSASRIQKALQQANRPNNVNKSKNITIDKVISNRNERPSDIIDRLSYRL